jgi:hypothetical protein
MAEPLILAFGRAVLKDFSGLPDSLLDIIPADLVVNAVLAAAAAPPPAGEHRIYHAASGSRNPLRLRQTVGEAAEYFEAHPLRDRWGQAIGTPNWTFPSGDELTARGRLALRTVEIAQQLVERLPLGSRTTRWSDDLNEEKGRLERALNLAELYGVYMEVDCIFDSRSLMSLWERVPPEERERFPFDAAVYDWHDYFQRVHLPTVVRMSRADSGPRKGPGPSGSTRPGSDSNTALATLRRRAGRPNVLAVFDVDGTLVETNVVEYFF